MVVLKIFMASLATLAVGLAAQTDPLGPRGILRPWNWPILITATPVVENAPPQPVVVAPTPTPAGQTDVAAIAAPQITIVRVRSERLTLGANGSFTTTSSWAAGTLALYRNGLRQMPGLDYVEERESQRVMPLVLFSPADLVLVDYDK